MKLLLLGAISNSEALYEDGIKKRFGGGVMYGGRMAARLGIDTTVITIGDTDIEGGMDELNSVGVRTVRIPRPTSNNFSNNYSGEERKLYLRSYIDKPIEAADIKLDTTDFDSVILFPIFNEVAPSLLDNFSNQKVLLDPQGFTRGISTKTASGLYPIYQTGWKNMDQFTKKVDFLKLSHEDIREIEFDDAITEEEKIQRLADYGFSITILTRGANSTIIAKEKKPLTYVKTYGIQGKEIKAHQAGAGEGFAVAFMYDFERSHNVLHAVDFANACVSIHISGQEVNEQSIQKLTQENQV